jgi:hypothetical protein
MLRDGQPVPVFPSFGKDVREIFQGLEKSGFSCSNPWKHLPAQNRKGGRP